MAITQAQQLDLYKLAVGMFAAAPGLTYMETWARALDAGMTMPQVYEALTTSPEFQGLSVGFTAAATNQQFVVTFLDALLDDLVSAANFEIASNFMLSQLGGGVTRGQAIKNVIDTLDAIPASDPNFGAAAQRFDNRIETAMFFTEILGVRMTDVDGLRYWIASVTEDSDTVVWANQNLLGSLPQFDFTTQPDNIVGTRLAEPFFGVIDAANPTHSTFTAADTVDGRGSTLDALLITVTAGFGALPAARVSNIEHFLISDLGAGGTYDFALYDGERLVANNRSTAPVTLSDIASGATVRVQGDSTTTLGLTTFTMESNTAPVTLNIDGKSAGAPNITRAQTGPAAVTVTSTHGDNTVGIIDLDAGTALTGLTINVRGGDLTAKLAQDYAPGSTLTVIGSNDLDLSGARLSANFTLVDASYQRGGSTKVVLGGNTTSFTGGLGNDFVGLDAIVLNGTSKLDGGAGTNTLRISDGAALTPATATNISNFQVLRLSDDNDRANDTFDTSLLSGLVAVQIDPMSGGDFVTLTNLNATHIAAIAVPDVTTPFGATSGTFQTVTAPPMSALTFTTTTANVLELAFALPGNGGSNDLDNFTDGTGLLAALGQRIAVDIDQNTGYIVAYQDNKAYLYRAADGSDTGAGLAAGDITLIGRFDAIAVGAVDPVNFIHAAQ